jgi:hypothetical protein
VTVLHPASYLIQQTQHSTQHNLIQQTTQRSTQHNSLYHNTVYTCFGQSCLSSGRTDCLHDDELDWSKHVVTVIYTLHGTVHCALYSAWYKELHQPFVTYVPLMLRPLQGRHQNGMHKGTKHSKFCQRCSHVELT